MASTARLLQQLLNSFIMVAYMHQLTSAHAKVLPPQRRDEAALLARLPLAQLRSLSAVALSVLG